MTSHTIATLVLLGTTSCGAITRPAPWSLMVDSDPRGAIVNYRGADVGRTPCSVTVNRWCTSLYLRLPEHHSRIVELNRKFNYWHFGNLLFPGLVGLVFDWANHAQWYIDDSEPVFVVMQQDDRPRPQPNWLIR